MTTPDYAAELAEARRLANEAIEEIEFLTVVESLPEDAPEETAERVHDLLRHFTADVSAQAVRAYLTNGEPR